MTVLPIVERELRVAARQPATYKARMALPLTGSAIFLLFAFVARAGMPPHMIGMQLFYLGFGMLFLSCLLAGCQLTADTMSSEKREGTLGFLFLTDLKGYDIVLGKLVSSSIGAIYGALALLPLVSVMFLFGGVSGGAMLRLSLSSINVLFLSLTVGITCSCLSRETNKARSAAMLVLLCLIGAGPLLGLLHSYLLGFPSSRITLAFWVPYVISSPLMTFPGALDVLYFRQPSFFWITNAIVHALGWMFLGIAIWLAPRTWQEKAGTKRQFRWREWTRKVIYGTSESMAKQRARLLDINAILWLTSRERMKNLALWIVLGAMVSICLFFLLILGKDWWNLGTAFLFALFTNSILKASLAIESARRFSADRESGALELVLCTTMPVAEILQGQLLSVRRQYWGPFLAAFVLEIGLFIMIGIRRPLDLEGELFLILGAGYLVFWVDYMALPWVGMWKAMSCKIPKNAGLEAAVFIMGAPWVIFYLATGVITFLLWKFFHFTPDSRVFLLLCWVTISLLIAGWGTRNARRRLHQEFRTIAMARYTPIEPLTFGGHLGRFLGGLAARFLGRARGKGFK